MSDQGNIDRKRMEQAIISRLRRISRSARRMLVPLLLAVVTASMLPAAAPAVAQSAPVAADVLPLTVANDEQGVSIRWEGDGIQAASLAGAPTVRYGGYDLPMRLITVAADAGGPVTGAPVIEELVSDQWRGELQPARVLTPPAIGFDDDPFMLTPSDPSALPTSPVFVYSKGRVRGRELQVIAVSPIYADQGEIRFARRISARLAQAQAYADVSTALAATAVQVAATQPQIGATGELAPTNSAALRRSIRILVDAQGLQQVPLSQIADLGLTLDRLLLTHQGAVIPYELRNDHLFFYAEGDGDYWNARDVFWLTNQNGKEMATRSVAPVDAPSRTTAIERGVWRNNTRHVSQHAGPDGDHWYAADMKVDPGMQGNAAEYPTFVADLSPRLPLASGAPSRFVPNLTTYIKGEYELELKVGNRTEVLTISTVNNAASAQIWQPEVEVNGTAAVIRTTLKPGDTIAGLLVDSLSWEQPVSLQLKRAGAIFTGVAGRWQYRMTDAPNGFALYDITDPLSPQRLLDVSNATFEDGEDARTYLVSGPGTVHTPKLAAHVPVSFNQSDGADALYIAPADFIDALEPLVEFRESQGYRVKVIDVQDIYDAWGYGHVQPDAIRTFLRFAVANWNPAPISVVLVSDGTRDPFNYEERQSTINYIPPYLRTSFTDQNGFERYVDPWLGQNGCENCYAQLDGDDPLNNEFETPGRGFLTDIWLGRFPVKSAQETAGVVSKIITYETAQNASIYWQRTAGFLADDYHLPNGGTDSAGDFISYSEEVIELLPSGISAARVYYDPQDTSTLPWYEEDAARVRERAIDLAATGPGLLTYNGHANHWQWAGTVLTSETPYIFGLYDVDLLKNRDQLFVNLSMTCYTAQFFQPSNSGTTLDERMFVHPDGGASAVWGPSGLSVLHGHDDLQYGFHKLLWSSAPGTMRMGELMEAGYQENFSPSAEREKLYSCCEDVRRTFLLFGDPLMTVHMTPTNSVYLPMVMNR